MFRSKIAKPQHNATATHNLKFQPSSFKSPAFGNEFDTAHGPRLPVAPSNMSGAVQLKSAFGELNDPLEQEADRAADQVTDPTPSRALGQEASGVIAGAQPSVTSGDQQLDDLRGGAPLEPSVRARMERGFGFDFRNVRVHTGAEAELSAQSFNALAYTLGRHVVFRHGLYSPHTRDGRRLLAHELTHVIQQQRPGHLPARQLKAQAMRFQDEPTLDDISEGKKVLKSGDKGEAVLRITSALRDLGFYAIVIVDDKFDYPVATAVSSYQTHRGLSGTVPDGTVEKKTFDKLDQEFSAGAGFKVERDVLSKQKSGDIPAQTQTVDPTARAASARAISTEPPVNPATGLPPTFVPEIVGKGKYADRMRAAVDQEILDEWNSMGKGATAKHGSAGSLYDAPTVDSIAVESQKAVDAVFGEYTKGKPATPLKMGVNVQDAFKKKEDDLKAGGKAAEDDAVDWRVQKILNGDPVVKSIDREHGAIQTRALEKPIVDKIKADMIAKYRDKLLETHKAWPGFEQGGVVFVQLFKGATPDAQRRERWDFFQTFIHEYIHSLEHPDHITYRGGLGEQKGGFTLREGTTDYFTKIVWSSIKVDEPLRAKIEGPVHDPAKPFPVPPLNTYPEAENAERLAGVVGIRNVAAAFFLGMVEKIGKK